MVLVGGPSSILIPDMSRARYGVGRLRGLRLLHTHLTPEPLSQEDLNDLVFLRLDSLAALTVTDGGDPQTLHYAHLLAANPDNRPYMVHGPLPWDRAEVDFAALTRALEEELGRGERSLDAAGDEGRALLVAVGDTARAEMESSLAELAELARTAGLTVAGTMLQRVPKLNPKFLLGKGKLAELETQTLQAGAGIIVFDRELSTAQLRDLGEATERKVIDRTQLILDIFAQRAVTRAGKLQVELAQLKYTLPRLTGHGTALSRLAGGIGGRGPGETKLELDRRRVRERMDRIQQDLRDLRKQRAFVRGRRAKAGLPLAALVGYTNAGKSTLLNALTNADVLAEDKLFATLDPVTRRLRFPRDRELILTDTVGFIRSLPADLREAFRATLEELASADLLIHVADASHLELDEQMQAVEDILADLGLRDTPRILVLNKSDRLGAEEAEILLQRHPEAIPISALTRRGLDSLAAAIVSRLDWERALDAAP